MKDEKKYVVDILCLYENVLEDIYAKAGVIQLPQFRRQATRNGSLQENHSAPVQPDAHFKSPDPNDHMNRVSVPFVNLRKSNALYTSIT